MSYGHLLTHALRELEKATSDYMRQEHIEKAGDTIMACSIAAAIAGVGSGWLPGAGALIATTAWVASIWTMYVRVNIVLGIKIKDNILKSLASAFLTNIIASAGTLILYFIAGFALAFIPGLGSLGAVAIDGFIGFVTVYASGLLYIRLLTKVMKGKGEMDLSDVDIDKIVKETTEESNVKDVIKEGKKMFKEAKKKGEFEK